MSTTKLLVTAVLNFPFAGMLSKSDMDLEIEFSPEAEINPSVHVVDVNEFNEVFNKKVVDKIYASVVEWFEQQNNLADVYDKQMDEVHFGVVMTNKGVSLSILNPVTLNRWEVTVTRTVTKEATFTIEANNPKDAQEKALQMAYDTDFNAITDSGDADYNVTRVGYAPN